ncbi:GDSL-type esterase/lipase family protein [Aeromonas media]|uniref:GDSL-type esterase/lipase family protein n=1 Tax=Aeromonas media TaxID=651 RepID=UPI0030D8AB3F
MRDGAALPAADRLWRAGVQTPGGGGDHIGVRRQPDRGARGQSGPELPQRTGELERPPRHQWRGIGGAGRARLPALLAEHRPALVILLEGGNDMLRGSGEGVLKANLAAMIEAAQGSGAQVLLVAVPRKSLFADGAPLYGELAQQYGLVLDEDSIGELLRTPGLKSDAVHFNAQGYGALAERLHRLLQERGAL